MFQRASPVVYAVASKPVVCLGSTFSSPLDLVFLILLHVFLELSWFFYNPTDVGNLISGSSAFKLDSGSITIMKVKVKSHSVMSNSLQPHGLYNPWNSPGQNTGVGSLSLLQGIFSIQGYNTGLPHCRQILYQLILKGYFLPVYISLS